VVTAYLDLIPVYGQT